MNGRRFAGRVLQKLQPAKVRIGIPRWSQPTDLLVQILNASETEFFIAFKNKLNGAIGFL